MPYINSASIQNGQIIQASHVLNIINTFNDTATTDIKVRGTASFNEVSIGNLRVLGTASVETFITTYYSSSIIYSSGSTKFGDTFDDTHQMTGSLGVTGSISTLSPVTTGRISIKPFISEQTPALGTGSGSFFLGGDNGVYGLYMGVSSSGITWLQSNRSDGIAEAYNISLQPVAGNVCIGKINSFGAGPKLDISGSVVITGSLVVTQDINTNLIGTASYASQALTASYVLNVISASNANLLDGLNSTDFLTVVGDQIISSDKTVSSVNKFAIQGPTDEIIYLKGGTVSGFDTVSDLLFYSNTDNVLAGLYQDGTGFELKSGNFIGNLTGTASLASTASLARNATSASLAITSSFTLSTISASFAATASLARNATSASFAATASFALNSTTVFTGSLATTGSNNFRGVQNISGSVNITGSLTVSGSTTFTNIGPTVFRGSLTIVGEDGVAIVSASRTVSSSISSSTNITSASFDGTGFASTVGGSVGLWDSNFSMYYSGVSSSYETQISPVYSTTKTDGLIGGFRLGFSSGITLSPAGSGSIDTYKLYVYNPVDGGWYSRSGISLAALQSGITVNISGDTSAQLSNDLQVAGFDSIGGDPTSNENSIFYTQQFTFNVTQSAVVINTPRIFPTSSGLPPFTGSDGQFMFGTTGGNHYIYVWMSGAWRSGSLV